jgi:hypothetical protein
MVRSSNASPLNLSGGFVQLIELNSSIDGDVSDEPGAPRSLHKVKQYMP